MKIKTLGDLRKLTKDLSNDFKIDLRVRRRLDDEELKTCLYPYPYYTDYVDLEFDDIGYSDKDFCVGCEVSRHITPAALDREQPAERSRSEGGK